MVVPQNGWFMREIRIWSGWFGTPISGNLQMNVRRFSERNEFRMQAIAEIPASRQRSSTIRNELLSWYLTIKL